MKTLNNLFGKSASAKNINDFNNFSLNVAQMSAIKGGTTPIVTDNPVKTTSVTTDNI